MNDTQMNPRSPEARRRNGRKGLQRACFTLAALSVLSLSTAADAFAQKSFSRTYAPRKNVYLKLTNSSGTIQVEAWQRNDIKVSVTMESPAARVEPEMSGDGLTINVVDDNRGRGDVGDVNFKIYVPVNSTVDLETKRGNITVRGVEGSSLRAHVTSEGDIELTGIRARTVLAENTMGNIVFDADLLQGGTYELKSLQGDTIIRIPADSRFRLMGLGRNINLGPFENIGYFEFLGRNRKVVGKVGDDGAILSITNQRGTIVFTRR